jgi:hypothetical protein
MSGDIDGKGDCDGNGKNDRDAVAVPISTNSRVARRRFSEVTVYESPRRPLHESRVAAITYVFSDWTETRKLEARRESSWKLFEYAGLQTQIFQIQSLGREACPTCK